MADEQTRSPFNRKATRRIPDIKACSTILRPAQHMSPEVPSHRCGNLLKRQVSACCFKLVSKTVWVVNVRRMPERAQRELT
jgi:hypothetical protein